MIFLMCQSIPFSLRSQCLTIPNVETELVGGIACGTTSPGSATVRVYLHLIKNTDCSGGMTETQLNALKQYLNTVYGAQNIQLNFPNCNLDVCDNSINTDNIADIFNTESIPDGINGYLFNHSGGGLAYSIPSTNFYAGGLDFATVAHELGHCLGLYHTFECRNGNECVDRDDVTATESGDLICDTDADPNRGVNTQTCTKTQSYFDDVTSECQIINTCNGDEYNPPISNIMSYYGSNCTNTFTPGQAERMKLMMENSPTLSYASGDGSEKITTNTTWTTDRNIDFDLVIMPGKTLTVQAKVRMATSRRIIVMGGATLIVDGGTLTVGNTKKVCVNSQNTGSFWKGVEIGRNGGRGLVRFINGATMEHSYSGLFNSTGGLTNVLATGSNFLNNRTSVDMISQTRSGVYINFQNCTIQLNGSYKGSDLHHQIILGNGLANFGTCTIENATSLRTVNKAAIYENGCALSVRNSPKISGFHFGVSASGNSATYRIEGNHFENFLIGVQSIGVSHFSLQSNEFKAGAYGTNHTSTGVLLRSGTGFAIRNNDFINLAQAPRRSIGMEVVIVDDIEDNYIGPDNTFTGLYPGIRCSQFRSRRLLITCNDFINCREDIEIQGTSQIKMVQKFDEQPAGNTFTYPVPQDMHLRNSASQVIQYWYNGLIQNHEPTKIINVSNFRKDDDGQRCQQTVICVDCYSESIHDSRYSALITSEEEANDELWDLLDGGQSSYWISSIEEADSNNANQILDSIELMSPNLSVNLIQSIWLRSDIFTGEQRFQLVLDNPLTLMDIHFRDFLQGGFSGITSVMLATLDTLSLPSSGDRLDLIVSWEKISHERMSLCHQLAAFHMIEDTVGITKAIKWLDRLDVPNAKMDAALLALQHGDSSNLEDFLDDLEDLLLVISTDQAEDIELFLELMDILGPVYDDGRDISQLDSAEITDLIAISESGYRYVSTLAGGMLEFYYGISSNYQALTSDWNVSDSDVIFLEDGKIVDKGMDRYFEVYPNPVGEELNVLMGANNNFGELHLSITDLFGRTIVNFPWNSNYNFMQVNTRMLLPGVYVLRIASGEEQIYLTKFIK